ncbi:hypothetical protein O8I67_02075 [Streptococcus uberis]|uniref:hypothetical protein n=1 Tax=Streptococcus uberis TaxID=1349 RepID=UPI0022B8BF6E|nr:hypothetical protein [Streptococcus uberis]MCZ8465843.1 hypothetical protein [Streptococcus uberis]
MKLKKYLKFILIFSVLLLVGCSKEKMKTNHEDKKSIGFYQSLKDKERSIWYQATGNAKDDTVEMVFVFQGDEVVTFDLENAEQLGYDSIRVKDIAKLSDKEIISKVVDLNDKIVSNLLYTQYNAQDDNILYLEDQIKSREKDPNSNPGTLSEMKKGLEETKILKEKLGKISPNQLKADNGSASPYSITLNTDKTGNNVTDFDLDFKYYSISTDSKSPDINETNSLNFNLSNPSTFDILDKHYSSFMLNEDDTLVFFAKIKNLNNKVVFDDVKTEGKNITIN